MEKLKEEVVAANQELQRQGLVIFTWGNASAIDRQNNRVVIKPSGISYEDLTPEKMSVVDLSGNILEGELRPSSDTPTHLMLYRKFPEIGGVVHTHSATATAWAQAKRSIPCMGTTHADHFNGEIPCTRPLTRKEAENNYEENTGLVISERFTDLDYQQMPAVLVAQHGPFTWGKNGAEAVHHSAVLEAVAEMALKSIQLGWHENKLPNYILEKHYFRKHGKNAYYGQK